MHVAAVGTFDVGQAGTVDACVALEPRTKDRPWKVGVGRCARKGDGQDWQQPEEGSVAKLGERKGEKGDGKELF